MHSEEERGAMQRALDKVWDWFVVQKKPQSRWSNTCMYRGPKGTMCAVGLLIPDSEYLDSLEGNTSAEARRACPSLRQYPEEFLCELQAAHDNLVFGPEKMASTLTKIAKEFALQVPG